MLLLALPQIYTGVFYFGSLSLSTMLGLKVVAHLYLFFTRVFSRV